MLGKVVSTTIKDLKKENVLRWMKILLLN
jgi:hypothetical protein